VKLDFSNAFISLHLRDMLLAVRNSLLELFPYSFSAYAYPSILFYGPHKVMLDEGQQQGDPMGSAVLQHNSAIAAVPAIRIALGLLG